MSSLNNLASYVIKKIAVAVFLNSKKFNKITEGVVNNKTESCTIK